ncbi:MAG: hypothetical protein HC857_12965, partial [Synechococcales cyanobacterium RU_4_20]|nr:hypothetical protein [Synechococcales cyanobacterium RU_4_20]
RILPAQWEHLVLTVMLKRQRIQKHDAIAAIETNIIEVLFDILQAAPYINQIACNIVHKTIGDSPVTILGTPDEFISKARLLLKEWQATGLANYSPNLAPVPISQDGNPQKTQPSALCGSGHHTHGQALDSRSGGQQAAVLDRAVEVFGALCERSPARLSTHCRYSRPNACAGIGRSLKAISPHQRPSLRLTPRGTFRP